MSYALRDLLGGGGQGKSIEGSGAGIFRVFLNIPLLVDNTVCIDIIIKITVGFSHPVKEVEIKRGEF